MTESKITSGYEPLNASDLEAINLVRSYQQKIDDYRTLRCKMLGFGNFYAMAEMEFSSFISHSTVWLRAYYFYGSPREGHLDGRDIFEWKAKNMFEAYADGTLEAKLKEFVKVLDAELNIPSNEDRELKIAEEMRRAHSE